jgi:hypothetical protein
MVVGAPFSKSKYYRRANQFVFLHRRYDGGVLQAGSVLGSDGNFAAQLPSAASTVSTYGGYGTLLKNQHQRSADELVFIHER